MPINNEQIKKKLFDMLNDCNEQLIKYKELIGKGMSNDKIFEAIYSSRKQVILDILELINK